MQPEPVSPELVLVDPELAQRERARLEEKARLVSLLDGETPRPVVEWDYERPVEEPRSPAGRDVRGFARRKVLPAALLGSLLANGFLAAALVVRSDSRQEVVAAPAGARPVQVSRSSQVAATSTALPTAALPQRALVERQLVALILQAPALKLPRAFVDPATGLVRNNLQVRCRRGARSRSYLCAVQLSSADAKGGILVRYWPRRGGRGVFRWYGYKRDVGTARFLQTRTKLSSKKVK